MTAPKIAPGRYQLVPPLDDENYAALYEDIKAAGVRVPIDIDEQGNILDGHHRKAIADEVGRECPVRVVEGLASDAAKEDYAITVNGARRQMSVERRRELATTSLKTHTRLSDREHARRCGVSHTYIANLREVLELAGAIDPAPSRERRGGGEYPADRLATVANPDDHRPTPATEAEPPSDAARDALARQIIDERVESGELIRLVGGGLIEAESFDPAVHERADEPSAPPEFVSTPNGPVPAEFAAALDKLVPDEDPHAQWRIGFLKRVHAVHAVMRSKPHDVAEMANERCLDELARCVEALTEYRHAVTRAVMAGTPDNVTQLRRVQ